MNAEFEYLDGPFRGERRVIRKDFATLGRDPSADLTFDSRADEGVSGRHAAIYRQGGQWMLRDLGGMGGTWLNDTRLRSDTPLAPGDVIRLGHDGPRVAFGLVAPGVPAVPAPPSAPPVAGAPAPPRAAARPPATPGARVEAPRRGRRPWLALFGVAAAVTAWWGLRERPAPPASPPSATPVPAPPDTAPLTPTIPTAPLSLDSVVRVAGPAVVLVVAGYEDGSWPVGSGVVIEARGDTAWVATSSRLAADPRGRPPVRIALLLPRASGYARAELATPLDGSGAALLRIRGVGGVLAATLGALPDTRDSVAVLGVVLGTDSLPEANWRQEGIRVAASAASMAGFAPGGNAGPGHGVFDRGGRLVGLVGPADAGSPRLIPVARLRELLDRRVRPE